MKPALQPLGLRIPSCPPQPFGGQPPPSPPAAYISHMAVGQNRVPLMNIKIGEQMDVHPPQNGIAVGYATHGQIGWGTTPSPGAYGNPSRVPRVGASSLPSSKSRPKGTAAAPPIQPHPARALSWGSDALVKDPREVRTLLTKRSVRSLWVHASDFKWPRGRSRLQDTLSQRSGKNDHRS